MRASARPAQPPGERLGRYDLLLPLASGGMATVYLARTRGIGGFEREVAIKLMHPHLREHRQFSVDLIEEAKLSARIRHPNVVPVLDVGSDRFGVYLVMEYVEGASLSGLLKTVRAAPPPEIALRVLIDMLSGLHAAHELTDDDGRPLGVVHRDVSPQNVLVGLDGIARLTDFGIARAATRISHTRTGTTKGKLAYMSPEQANAQLLDRRSDIWAAAVMAWELFAGRRLFSGSEAAIVLDIVTGKVPPLLSIRPDLPEGIAQAIESALRVDVCERCPTAAELCERIASGCQGDWTPADHRRVGEWVEEVLGDTLVTRRRQARALAVERGPLAETPEAPPERVLTAADPVWLMPTEDINLLAPAASSPVEPVTVATTPSLGRRAWPLAAAGIALAALAALGVSRLASSHADEPEPRAASATSSVPVQNELASEPERVEPPPPSAVTSAAAPPPASSSAPKPAVRRAPSAARGGGKPFRNPY